MKKIFLALLAFAVIFVGIHAYAIAGVTVTESGSTVQVTGITSDFTYSASCMMAGIDGMGVRLIYMLFIPGDDTNDVCSIKEGSPAGPESFYCTTRTSNDQKIIYFHGAKKRPVIDYSACSLSTGASVVFQLWPQQRI